MDNDEAKDVFETRLVQFLGHAVSILMQSVNGPCALVAICNVLLLRGEIHLNEETGEVTLNALMDLMEMWLSDPNRRTDGFFLTKHQDILKVLESFANYVTVDVGILNIQDFEFSLEMAVFKFLNIELVHGSTVLNPKIKARWLEASRRRFYNNLQERLPVLSRNVPSSSAAIEVRETAVSKASDRSLQEEKCIYEFLLNQITYSGLSSLHDHLQEQKLYALYWNNHFRTLVKHNKGLYMLVTDVAFKNKPSHVWEKLCEIPENSTYYTEDFIKVEEDHSNGSNISID